jgi:hypothetical protein
MSKKSGILIYQNDNNSIKLEVNLEEETVWLSQNQMVELFGKTKSTISEHIKNIFTEEELTKSLTVRNFRTVQMEGKREVERDLEYYNLDMIISVGYRVKSKEGILFRKWATQRLKEYIIKGFSLNKDRFISGKSMNYFDELQEKIREIRLSERVFYQKVKDIFSTSYDYDYMDSKAKDFFAKVQNKLLWAISKKTAAELVFYRTDSVKPLINMKSFSENRNIRKSDITIAKNYLEEEEVKLLGLLVEQYLAFAETMAMQEEKIYMNDWVIKLDAILKLNGRELLTHAGKVTQEKAEQRAEFEYKKYKEKQKEIEQINSLKELEYDLEIMKKVKNEN